jgi:flagellar FliJ protein
MNREHFITRLHQAVDMQTTVVAQSESRVRQAELGWMATRQDVRSVDRLLENERQSQQQAQDRREQSALDEHAVLQFGRAGANGLAGG